MSKCIKEVQDGRRPAPVKKARNAMKDDHHQIEQLESALEWYWSDSSLAAVSDVIVPA